MDFGVYVVLENVSNYFKLNKIKIIKNILEDKTAKGTSVNKI